MKCTKGWKSQLWGKDQEVELCLLSEYFISLVSGHTTALQCQGRKSETMKENNEGNLIVLQWHSQNRSDALLKMLEVHFSQQEAARLTTWSLPYGPDANDRNAADLYRTGIHPI